MAVQAGIGQVQLCEVSRVVLLTDWMCGERIRITRALNLLEWNEPLRYVRYIGCIKDSKCVMLSTPHAYVMIT